MIRLVFFALIKTTAGRFWLIIPVLIVCDLTGCGSSVQPQSQPEEEAFSRTEFTNRIENFFEYEPLKAGKPSQFRIHLTDLSDGSPVEKAEVKLLIQGENNKEVGTAMVKIGKVTGIYVAEVTIAKSGLYKIEFQVKNDKLNERMLLSNFKVE